MAQAMIIASGRDAALARQLEAALRDGAQAAVAPQPPDLDNSDMRAGAEAAIRSSAALILTVSAAALDDRWIRFAAETARKSGTRLIPVLAGPVELGALSSLTGGPEPVPAGSAPPFDVARDLAALRLRLARSPAPVLAAAAVDAGIALQAAETLRAAGLEPFSPAEPDLDDWEARSGAEGTIRSAPAVILLLTEAAMRSRWVRFAAESARKARTKLIPVLFEELEDGALLYLTGGAAPVLLDVPDDASVEEGGRALGVFEARHAEAIRALLAGQAAGGEKEKQEAPAPITVTEATLDAMDDGSFEDEEASGAGAEAEAEAEADEAASEDLYAGPADWDVDAPDAEPEEPAPSKKTAVLAGQPAPSLEIPAAPSPAPGGMIRPEGERGAVNGADAEIAAEAPRRADRMRRMEAPSERSQAPSAAPFRAAKLFENAPRRMRVGKAKVVTVRISRDTSGGEGMSGSVSEHQILAASAMTVTLDDPSFGYAIRPLTPATQWVDREALAQIGIGLEGQPAEWRWSVEPLKTGVRPLVIRASARVTDPSGMSADAGLPEQMIEIRVGVDPAATAKNVLKWALFAMVAGVLGHYGEIIVQAVRAFLG